MKTHLCGCKTLHLLILLLFITLSNHLSAQQEYIDSIKNELTTAETKVQVKMLSDIAFAYAFLNPDSGLDYAQRSMKMAEEMNDTTQLATATGILGINYRKKGDYANALEAAFKSLNIYKQLNKQNSIAAMLLNISSIYMDLGSYEVALKYTLDALTYYQNGDDKLTTGITLKQAGTIYFRLKDYGKAYEYFNLADETFKKAGDHNQQARLKNNFGMYYHAIGDYNKSIQFHKEGIKLSAEEKILSELANNYVNLGNSYKALGQFDSALAVYHKGLDIYVQTGNNKEIATTTGNVGTAYLKRAQAGAGIARITDTKKAIVYFDSAYTQCKQMKLLHPQIEFSGVLSQAWELLGNYNKALGYLKEHNKLHDSLSAVANLNNIMGLELDYKLQLKDNELKIKDSEIQIAELKLSRRNVYIILACVLAVILGLVLIIIWKRWRRASSANKKLLVDLDEQIAKTMGQMNELTKNAKILSEIAYLQAHHVRGPVTTLLAATNYLKKGDYANPNNKFLIESIDRVTRKLDEAVKEVIMKANE